MVSVELYIDSTIDGDLGAKTGDLSGGEVVPARVGRVVHEVLDSWERKGISDEVLSPRYQVDLRSRPGALGQVSRVVGQPEAERASAGVSST